jgi:hypothetical protein
VNGIKSAVSSDVFGNVLSKVTPLTEDMTAAIKIQRLDVDIKNLDEMIATQKALGQD